MRIPAEEDDIVAVHIATTSSGYITAPNAERIALRESKCSGSPTPLLCVSPCAVRWWMGHLDRQPTAQLSEVATEPTHLHAIYRI